MSWYWPTVAIYAIWAAAGLMVRRRRQWSDLAPRNITSGRINVRVYERVPYWHVWRSMRAAVDLTVDGHWVSTHFGGVATIRTAVHTSLIIGVRTQGEVAS